MKEVYGEVIQIDGQDWPKQLKYYKHTQPIIKQGYPKFTFTAAGEPNPSTNELKPFNEMIDLLNSQPNLIAVYNLKLYEFPAELLKMVKEKEPLITGWFMGVLVGYCSTQLGAQFNTALERAAGALMRSIIETTPMEVVLNLSVGEVALHGMLVTLDGIRACQGLVPENALATAHLN